MPFTPFDAVCVSKPLMGLNSKRISFIRHLVSICKSDVKYLHFILAKNAFHFCEDCKVNVRRLRGIFRTLAKRLFYLLAMSNVPSG